jgi:hypothetical protein
MSKMTKVLLVLSLSCLTAGLVFVTGIVSVGEAVALYVTLPAGAIFFGLFLISLSLQAQSALFDEEQRMALVAAIGTNKSAPSISCCEGKKKEELALVAGM